MQGEVDACVVSMGRDTFGEGRNVLYLHCDQARVSILPRRRIDFSTFSLWLCMFALTGKQGVGLGGKEAATKFDEYRVKLTQRLYIFQSNWRFLIASGNRLRQISLLTLFYRRVGMHGKLTS